MAAVLSLEIWAVLRAATPAVVSAAALNYGEIPEAHSSSTGGDARTGETVSGGNLQNEPHDVQLVDPNGVRTATGRQPPLHTPITNH